MIEKNSNNVQCEVCGNIATVSVQGHNYCDACKDSAQAQEITEIQEAFKGE